MDQIRIQYDKSDRYTLIDAYVLRNVLESACCEITRNVNAIKEQKLSDLIEVDPDTKAVSMKYFNDQLQHLKNLQVELEAATSAMNFITKQAKDQARRDDGDVV